jgi:DNA-binding NarL/FixJ family response regulator
LITLQQSTLDLLAEERRPAAAALEEPLSPRELEVLAMLAEGLSNKLIAHHMGISEHTVKFHVTSIMAKLHAASRTDAVMQGIRRGLVMI